MAQIGRAPALFGSHVSGVSLPSEIIVDAADFDGVNDYMTRGAGFTGAADSKSGILSMWFRLDGGNTNAMLFFASATTVGGSTTRFQARRETNLAGNLIIITGRNAAGTEVLRAESNTGYTSGAQWHHLLTSWDGATGAQSFYVDDTDVLNDPFSSVANDDIDHTVADWSVGANAAGSSKLNACLAEVYFAPGQYLDFSVEANRRLFISSGGKPVDLGADGSGPTGVAPAIYLHLDDAEAVANFATNAGSGGDYTVVGSLDTASSSPSD